MAPIPLPVPAGWRRVGAAAWVVALAVITTLALLPADAGPPSSGWDKLDHLAAFGLLSGLGVAAFGARHRALLVVSLLVHGGLIEGLQRSIPGREASWTDWWADALGVALGLGVLWIGTRLRR